MNNHIPGFKINGKTAIPKGNKIDRSGKKNKLSAFLPAEEMNEIVSNIRILRASLQEVHCYIYLVKRSTSDN